jgi:hypothetical protein
MFTMPRRLVILVRAIVMLTPSFAYADGVTFRDSDVKFRIVYPSDWTLKTPRGVNVKFKVVH